MTTLNPTNTLAWLESVGASVLYSELSVRADGGDAWTVTVPKRGSDHVWSARGETIYAAAAKCYKQIRETK